MSTTATLVYNLIVRGLAQAVVLLPQMQSPPLPIDFLHSIGVGVTSDSTSGTTIIARTIVLSLVPTVNATATATVQNSSSVSALNLVLPGLGYVAPPIVVFDGGGPAGCCPGDPPNPGRKALAKATLNINNVAVSDPGSGYSLTPQVIFQGGLGAGGVAATGTVTTDGAGHITGVILTTPGSGYIAPPTIVFVDPTGSGSHATAIMQVGALILIDGGAGYLTAPTVTLVPLFKYIWPDSIDSFVSGVTVTAPGDNYSAKACVTFVGGLAPGGVAATGHVIVDSVGHILSIVIDTPGSGYIAAPTIVITDPCATGIGGVGGVATAAIQSKQSQPFFNLLTGPLLQATASPVTAVPPVIA